MLTFFDSSNKINAIYPHFTKKLGLFIRLIDIKVENIDDSIPKIYIIVVTAFSFSDKANQEKKFEKTYWCLILV